MVGHLVAPEVLQVLAVLVIQIMEVEKQLELQVKDLLVVPVQENGILVVEVELAVLVLVDLPMGVQVFNIQPLALSFGAVVAVAQVIAAQPEMVVTVVVEHRVITVPLEAKV